MELKFLNVRAFREAAEAAVAERIRKVFDTKGKFILNQYAEVLRQKFMNSEEFQELGGKLQGEFGFTDAEVNALTRISSLLVPGHSEITVSTVNTQGSEYAIMLEWVDFEALKEHDFAKHVLTRLDESGRVIGITDIISWVEWLEEGATIRGYVFSRPGGTYEGPAGEQVAAAKFSRSGQGLMKKHPSGVWRFQPTRIFERIAKQERGGKLRKGLGVMLRRASR